MNKASLLLLCGSDGIVSGQVFHHGEQTGNDSSNADEQDDMRLLHMNDFPRLRNYIKMKMQYLLFRYGMIVVGLSEHLENQLKFILAENVL
jgi:hypothetical protein